MRAAVFLSVVVGACATGTSGEINLTDAGSAHDTGVATLDAGHAAHIDAGVMPSRDVTLADAGADLPLSLDVPSPDVAPVMDVATVTDIASPTDTPSPTDTTAVVDVARATDVGAGDAGPGEVVTVWAHTDSELFAVNPSTLDVTSVGPFGFPSDSYSHQMTDLAVTASSELWGVTFNALYRINSVTAACTLVAGLSDASVQFNGLTFVPAGVLGSSESLVASTVDGLYYEVNTTTGAVTALGVYGLGIGSSGDIVSVAGAGTYATVTLLGTEYLATLNPHTGAASIIGPTGVTGTWGLGYWRALLYGFTESGDFVTIDITTGHATTVRSYPAQSWWGAGVTTSAPTNPQ